MGPKGESLGDDGEGPPTESLEGEPLKVAPEGIVSVCVIAPQVGESKLDGAELLRGVSIARAEIEGQAWRKQKLTWVDKDSKSTEAGAIAAYHECFGEGHSIIIGPMDPAAVSALIPIAAAHKVVLIVPEVGGAVPSTWDKHMAAISPPASHMGVAAALDATGPRQLRKGAVLAVEGIFGESLTSTFKKTIEARGGSLVFTRALDPAKPEAWRSAALEAGVAEAEAIFVVGPSKVAEQVVAVMDSAPLSASHAWFIDWSMFPDVLDESTAGSRRRIHWVNRELPPGSFSETYTTRYQAPPLFTAGAGYDAVLLAATAAEAAGGGEHEALVSSLSKLAGIDGAFGKGAVKNEGGVLFLDSAGFHIFEPQKDPDAQGMVFLPSGRN